MIRFHCEHITLYLKRIIKYLLFAWKIKKYQESLTASVACNKIKCKQKIFPMYIFYTYKICTKCTYSVHIPMYIFSYGKFFHQRLILRHFLSIFSYDKLFHQRLIPKHFQCIFSYGKLFHQSRIPKHFQCIFSHGKLFQ